MPKIPVALQLYTVRDQMATDFQGTVRQVAQMGYAGVELAGTGGLSAEEMRDLLSETGLRAAGSHIGIADFERDLDGVIAYSQAIGNRYVGVPVLGREMRTPAGFGAAARRMNAIAKEVTAAGLTFYYHNHAFEFELVDGVRGVDILYGETDPELVKLEADVYWMAYAGEDPAALIRKYPGRFTLIHLKDMTGEGDARTYAEIGEGHLDFRPIFAASEEKDFRGMFRQALHQFDQVVFTRYLDNPRAVPPEELAAAAGEFSGRRYAIYSQPADALDAVRAAAAPDDLICVAGSFFIAAEIRRRLAIQPPPLPSKAEARDSA